MYYGKQAIKPQATRMEATQARISHSLRWISTIAEVQRAHGRKYKIYFYLHQLKKGDKTV